MRQSITNCSLLIIKKICLPVLFLGLASCGEFQSETNPNLQQNFNSPSNSFNPNDSFDDNSLSDNNEPTPAKKEPANDETPTSKNDPVNEDTPNDPAPKPTPAPKEGIVSLGEAVPFTSQKDPFRGESPLDNGESLFSKKYETTTTRLGNNLPHHYSKRQAFNSNETLINLRGKIINADSLKMVNGYQNGIQTIERNWSNLNPNLVYGIGSAGNSFVSYNMSTKKVQTIISLSSKGYSSCTLGSGEGNMSIDDKFVFLDCKKGSKKYGLSIDLKNKKILATLLLDQKYYNWGSFSQSGNYIIIQGVGHNNRAYLYNKNLKQIRKITDKLYHGDFGYNDKGEEVYVAISWDYIHYYRLSDNELVFTARGTNHGHLSCRNVKRPGWCYFSSNGGEVASVKIAKGNGSRKVKGSPPAQGILGVNLVEHMGFHRSSSANYAAQAKASASPSGTKVLINSDWYKKSSVSAYMIEFAETSK